MRYSIHGFSQRVALDLGLDNDHLLLLRWFVDFSATGKMKTLIIGNKTYHWIQYQKVCDDLPILATKIDTLYRKLKKLEQCNVIKRHTKRDKSGTYSYFTFSDVYASLISDPEIAVPVIAETPTKLVTEAPIEHSEKNPKALGKKSEGTRKKIRTKDISINNKSIRDRSHSISQKIGDIPVPIKGEVADKPVADDRRLTDKPQHKALCNTDAPVNTPIKTNVPIPEEEIKKIFDHAQVDLYTAHLFIESVIKKVYTDTTMPITLRMGLTHEEIRGRLKLLNYRAIDMALNKLKGVKNNKELYFAKCLLTAVVEIGVDDFLQQTQDE